ncbi:DUF2971 domain-containing protein [uncultured Ruegeria sp.]|uniref:DUF2971 domain-containing protein n=1 Tax=uncultured Ruegeria sp. TaxID=259304 RepID=UPI0026363C7F|nr:DUF2971 domain-containing protein [uncultured Ruegeria sp.]
MIETPKVFYKYREFNARFLESLLTDQVFFADPSAFNDPLDTKPHLIGAANTPDLRDVLNQLLVKKKKNEMTAAARSINYKGPKTVTHIDRQAHQFASSKLSEIAAFAEFFDPEIPTSPDEIENNGLMSEIERELMHGYSMGVFSLASKNNCPLMWSHYGDQHQGICVGYSLHANEPENVQQVSYGGDRSVRVEDVAAMLRGDEKAKKRVDNTVLLKKGEEWRYEEEWRLIGPMGLHNSRMELTEVVFGLKCPDAVKFSVIRSLEGRAGPDVQFMEVEEDQENFAFNVVPVDIGWVCCELPRRVGTLIEDFG